MPKPIRHVSQISPKHILQERFRRLHFFICSPKPTLYISKLVQACIKEPCHCFPWTYIYIFIYIYIYTHFSSGISVRVGVFWLSVWGPIGFQCILTRFPVSCLKPVFHPLHPKLAGLHPECPQSINNGSLEFKLPTIWTHEKQRWEEPEKRREEERRSKKRKSEKEEDPGAQKGRKIAEHCVFPLICGSGSKSRLAKAVGAEPCGQMRDEKLHAIARSTCPSQNGQNTWCSEHFWKLRCRKSARRCGAKHILRSNVYITGSEHFWTFRCRFFVAGARDSAPCQKRAKREGFVAFLKAMAGKGHLKRICTDRFSVAGAAKETCSSEMLGGQGADFLRRVAFWRFRSSVLGR